MPDPPMLCPMCCMREQGSSGFCKPCMTQRTNDAYLERQTAEAGERRQGWTRRTAPRTDQQREFDSERQRLHRLRERIKPREPVDPDSDPWELGNQALLLANGLCPSIKNAGPLAKLDELLELIRALAYGPHEPTEPVKAEPAPEPWG
jgi:hypothetical protein